MGPPDKIDFCLLPHPIHLPRWSRAAVNTCPLDLAVAPTARTLDVVPRVPLDPERQRHDMVDGCFSLVWVSRVRLTNGFYSADLPLTLPRGSGQSHFLQLTLLIAASMRDYFS
jgi:hypothetical protein